MKKLLSLFCIGLLLSLSSVYAQNINSYSDRGLFPHNKTYPAQSTFSSPESFMQTNFPANTTYGVKVISMDTDELGFTHYRLQQTIAGIPISKSMYLLHVKDGRVVSSNGEWFKNLPNLRKKPHLDERQALDLALSKIGADEYIWETDKAQQLAKQGIKEDHDINYAKPEGTLVYVSTNNELQAASLKLAFRFDIFATSPMSKNDVYIDATSGKVLFQESDLHEANTNGTASTGYYGSKSITVDQSGSSYYARQSGARSIELYNMNGGGLNNGNLYGTTISSSSSTFSGSGNARYYIDAYWGAEITYDFYKQDFNRNSYNNSGGKINLYVNGSGQGASNNAFWFGSTAYFGNSNSGTPFTSLDVVAHEITHGVTGTSANLTYQGESGALNESFSDIFGCYAEHYAGVGQKWTMGEYIAFQRSMSNPKQHNQPDTYQGSYWASTSSSQDNGGVHTNSGVMNYWFYLVSEGGSGSNDRGNSYSVSGIGIEKAAKIAYRALTSYLTASSGYSAARNAVIYAVRDLYGTGSCEEAAVTDAMYAIGVGSQFNGNCNGTNCDALTGLSVSSIGQTSATVSWNAVSGISSYTVEYKKSTDASYTSSTVSSSSTNLSGLSANTNYQVRVRYTCSNGQTADYASTSFTTTGSGGSCNALTGISASSITTNSAVVSWNAVSGVSSYTVEYKEASASSYTSATVSSNSASFSSLSENTTYNIRVTYTCSNGQTAPYASVNFTTEQSTGGGCGGVADYVSGQTYNPGDRVVYNGHIYEAIYYGTTWSPAYGYWSYIGACSTGGGGGNGCGVPDYSANQGYNPGDRVVENGHIYEALYYGTTWPPSYGYWSYVGPCGNSLNGFTQPTSDIEEELTVYPNPTSGIANISYNVAPSTANKLIITDMLGKEVLNRSIDMSNHKQTVSFDVSNLKPGIYIVRVGKLVERLSIQ